MNREFDVHLTPGRIAVLVALLLALIGGSAALATSLSRSEGAVGSAPSDSRKAGGHAAEGADHEEKGGHHEEKEGRVELTPAAIEKAGIEIRTAGPSKVAVTLSLPGNVSVNADSLAHVTPRVGGTVRSVRKQLGDRVTKGEVLASLDSRELAEVRREVQTTKERLGLAQATFDRQEKLWNEKVSAEKDFLAARQARAEAQIDHRSALQKMSAIGGSGSGSAYALIAPLDGTIIEKHISIGEVLKDDTQAFVIADLSSLWVNVTVYARDLSRVRVGQSVTVKAEGIAEPAQGTIVYLGQVVGAETRSALARVVLQHPPTAWRPGLFATATVMVDEVDAAVTVVDDAVQTVEGKEVVFVEENGAFQARPITIGRRGAHTGAEPGPMLEVTEGLKPGERYVGKNSFILKAELGKSEASHEH
jgi:cobalt-zinc-cadmium efflux system membrane fusion protein